jgi:DNA-binding response OmpR family regulator
MTDSSDITVLVVDDERDLADLYAVWLADAYAVETAYGGDEALERVDPSVDVVLLDRQMPGRSGEEVLAEIGDRGLDCSVAMVTATEPGFEVVDLGLSDYVTKPVMREELLSTVDALVTHRRGDSRLAELYSLRNKRSVLERHRTTAELDEHAGYQGLLRRMARLRSEVEDRPHRTADPASDRTLRRVDAASRGDGR